MGSVESQHAIQELAKLSKIKDITLLCHCQVSEPNLYCHRYLVKELIEAQRMRPIHESTV